MQENLRKQIQELEANIATLKEKILEQLRIERNLDMKKLDLEWRKTTLETEAKDRRMDMLITTLTHLSVILADPVAQRMHQLGEQQATA